MLGAGIPAVVASALEFAGAHPLVLVLALLLCVLCWSAAAGRWRSVAPAATKGNGITVGAPKLYDTRSLLLMLDRLREDLAGIKTLNQKALSASVGAPQATVSDESTVSAALTNQKPATSKTDSQDSSAGEKPDVAPSPQQSASDLLGEDISLSYSLFNNRLLLERALSDRLIGDDPRLQSVVGFPITIVTPWFAKGCAATVEVVLHLEHGDAPPTLVALLPQEKTYNVSALSTRAGRFAGAVAAGVFSMSASGGKSERAVYVYKDTDTVAFEGVGANKDGAKTEVGFGWQFRPVFGRPSVASGARQVFAVIGLPVADNSDGAAMSVRVSVRTSWRRYSARKGVVHDSPGWRSFFAARKPFAESKHVIESRYTSNVDAVLSPKIEEIEWHRTGTDNIVVAVRGENFFPGTTVFIGGKELTNPAEGLVLKSDRCLQLDVPFSALVHAAGVLNGRYGRAIPLEKKPEAVRLAMTNVGLVATPGRSARWLKATLVAADGSKWIPDDTWDKLPMPIVSMNNSVVPEPYSLSTFIDEKEDKPDELDDQWVSGLTFQALVPADLIPAGAFMVNMRFPFCGTEWVLSCPSLDATPVITVVRADGAQTTRLFLKGPNFDGAWQVFLDKCYVSGTDRELSRVSNCLCLEVDNQVLKTNRALTLVSPLGLVFFLDVPTTAVPAPSVAEQDAVALKQNQSATVALSGLHLRAVERVTLAGKDLPFGANVAGTRLTILVEAAAVPKQGKDQLLLFSDEGQAAAVDVLVTPTS